jgi:TonB family protein
MKTYMRRGLVLAVGFAFLVAGSESNGLRIVALARSTSLNVPQQADAPPAPIKKKKVVVSPGIGAGLILKMVAPKYPDEAKKARIKGVVLVKTEIGTDGLVVDAQAIDGPELLRAAAVDAVRQWTFRPYTLNGEAIEVETNFSIKIPK